MLKKNNNYKDAIKIGVILITFGITLLSNNYVKTKREKIFNDMNLVLLDTNLVQEKNEDETTENIQSTSDAVINTDNNSNDSNKNTSSNKKYEPYMGVLEIPEIGLKRGFYNKNSSLNNVDYNILFHSNSDFPDKENGNVILASHSGNSSTSYFKKLYLLEVGDVAYLTYNNIKYTYKIVDIYYEKKDGDVAIYRSKNKSVLTLITCTKNDNSKQTIYILERI